MNSYRFGTGREPTDEMLAQIMHEAATEAKQRNEEAALRHLDDMRREMKNDEAKWADRINEVRESCFLKNYDAKRD